MGVTRCVETLCRYYQENVGDESLYFKVKKDSYFVFFEETVFDASYAKLSTLQESTPPNSLIFQELHAIVADICDFQAIRGRRYFTYGSLTDPTNVVLEELKNWCRLFKVQRNLEDSMTELNKRIKYIRAILSDELFPSTNWTQNDLETILKVLYRTEKTLEKARSKLKKEHEVTQLRDTLMAANNGFNAILQKLTYYLMFILSDTPQLPVNAGDMHLLQTEGKTTEAVRKTVSGTALFELINHPLVKQVTSSQSTSNDLSEYTNSDDSLKNDNPYLSIRGGNYELKEGKLLELKRKPSKLLGIEPVIFNNHENAVRSFLILHGLFYELARIQSLIQTASSLAGLAGQLAIVKLHPMMQVITAYYQFIRASIESEMHALNAVVAQVVDDKRVFNRNKVTDTWLASQKKAIDFVGSLLADLEAISNHCNHISTTTCAGDENEMRNKAKVLIHSLEIQLNSIYQSLTKNDLAQLPVKVGASIYYQPKRARALMIPDSYTAYATQHFFLAAPSVDTQQLIATPMEPTFKLKRVESRCCC